ncbi:MAG: S8 family peptidase [Bulleidia sp.]
MKHLIPAFVSLLVLTGCQHRRIRVGVMDSGVNPMDLTLDQGWNYVDDNDETSDPIGHGTQMAKIITSIADDCVIVPMKVRSESPDVSTCVIAALYDAVDVYHCDVVCMAFSISHSDALQEAVRYAYDNDVILISACGNTGPYSDVLYPSGYEEVISVGALDENGKPADYSGHAEIYVDGNHESMQGTSVSCARLCGICAENHHENTASFRSWLKQNHMMP